MSRWFGFSECELTNWRSLVVVAIIMSGCAYNEPYPEKWAPVVHDPALCAHLGGDYVPYDVRSRLVMSWVAGNANPKPPARVLPADRLSLRLQSNTLTATAYLDGKQITQRQYDVQCGGDSLLLDLGRKSEAEQGIVGYGSTRLRLRKDSTGAIVVNEESAGGGVYGLIPFADSSSVWVGRFLPSDPNVVDLKQPVGHP